VYQAWGSFWVELGSGLGLGPAEAVMASVLISYLAFLLVVNALPLDKQVSCHWHWTAIARPVAHCTTT
jgi:hypothetical protein